MSDGVIILLCYCPAMQTRIDALIYSTIISYLNVIVSRVEKSSVPSDSIMAVGTASCRLVTYGRNYYQLLPAKVCGARVYWLQTSGWLGATMYATNTGVCLKM
jgi:hypothetical protein